MELEKKQAVALMRYGAIAPVVNGLPDGSASISAYFRKVAEQGILRPDGTVKRYDEKTLEKWYRLYCKGGFDALLPKDRSDTGESRKLDDELRSTIRTLYRTHPRMPAAEILRTLQDAGSVRTGDVSESTVRRYVRQLETKRNEDDDAQEMRRYERPHINEVWCGDSSRIPSIEVDGKKRKVYVIALLDDASRMVVGAGVFFEDTFVNLMAVAKSAVAKYGCPQMFNFDNGGPYKNQQMQLLAARLGSVVHYCRPYTPTAKAKIERWFRTLKDHWVAKLDMRQFHSLRQLEESLFAYVHTYNTTPHSSLNGLSPQDRFFKEPEKIRRLSQELLDRSFLLEIERRVSPDCVVSIEQVEYEVDARFAKQKVHLRYSPDKKEMFVVEPDGTFTPVRLLNKHDNAQAKREKVHLSGGES